MVRLTAHLLTIIRQVGQQPGMPILEIELLSNEEKRQLLEDFNRTATAYPRDKSIAALFSRQAAETPDNLALQGPNLAVTYRELSRHSQQLAHYLLKRTGIEQGEPVGLLLERSVEMIAAILGVLAAGGAYVPLAPDFPRESSKEIIADAGIKVIISQKKFIKTLNWLQWECASFHTFLCLDSWDIDQEEETEQSQLMSSKLWEYVGETAVDDITGGGWLSSYTGLTSMEITS